MALVSLSDWLGGYLMGTAAETASWNQVSNTPDFSTDGSTAASPAAAPASPQGQAVSSSLPLNYYVRFTLADGDVVTVNGGQLFALEGFSFSEQDSFSIGGQSGGAGAGKATFNPLQLTFSQLGLQPALLTALATGSHFKEVDVLGYSQANQLVTDDSFGLVLASNLGADSSGATQVSLEYGSQEIQQSTQLANGSLSPPVTARLEPGQQRSRFQHRRINGGQSGGRAG